MHGMVFTKIFRRLILGLWGATLCSCTTYRTLSIEILQPAGFHIEQGKKLALLERNIRNENSILTFMKNIPERQAVPQWIEIYLGNFGVQRCYNMFKRTGNGLLEPILYSAPFRSG